MGANQNGSPACGIFGLAPPGRKLRNTLVAHLRPRTDMRNSLLVLAAFCAAPLHTVASQNAIVLSPGSRIRVALPADGRARPAEVVAQHGDSLWLREPGERDTEFVAMSALTRLDLSLGWHSHVLRDAGIGLLWGVIGGGVLGLILGEDCTHDEPPSLAHPYGTACWFPKSQMVPILAGEVGALGTGLGAVIGLRPTETWQSLLADSRISIVLSRRGSEARSAIAVSITGF